MHLHAEWLTARAHPPVNNCRRTRIYTIRWLLEILALTTNDKERTREQSAVIKCCGHTH